MATTAVSTDSPAAPHAALRPGAWPGANGEVAFALWAPDAERVELVLGDDRRQPLQAIGDGYFAATLACAPGTRYRYAIDGGTPCHSSTPRGFLRNADVMRWPTAVRRSWTTRDRATQQQASGVPTPRCTTPSACCAAPRCRLRAARVGSGRGDGA
ncbi:hypothetical protein NB689_002975 [Xanthomonas sacchari]|nr:hypothetical protein [Xanthomonas sacchari]